MHTLVLETIEPAFSRGIIPTIPLAAHRADHAVLFQPVLEVKTGILTAPIRVMDSPAAGFLRNHAMVSASVTMSVVMRGFSDQPTLHG